MDHASIIFRIVGGLKNWDYKSKNQWKKENPAWSNSSCECCQL